MIEYKPIPGIDGYLIASNGDVLSLKRNTIMTPYEGRTLKLYSGGERHYVNVGRLADQVWGSEIPDGFISIPIEGLENYKINSHGEIYSLKCRKKLSHATWRGWKKVGLWNRVEEAQHPYTVHKLVALAFDIHKPSGATQINHIDGDKSNNHVSNLEWCTAKENTNHAIDMGLRPRSPKECAELGKAKHHG